MKICMHLSCSSTWWWISHFFGPDHFTQHAACGGKVSQRVLSIQATLNCPTIHWWLDTWQLWILQSSTSSYHAWDWPLGFNMESHWSSILQTTHCQNRKNLLEGLRLEAAAANSQGHSQISSLWCHALPANKEPWHFKWEAGRTRNSF